MPDDERAQLLRGIEALTHAIATRSIPRMLEPLLATELTVQQVKVLTVIVTAPDATSGAELATMFQVSMASMSKLVDRLVAQGLAERSTDHRDQRVRRVRPTRRGRAVVRQLIGARPELGGDILAGLTTEELGALEQGLRAVSRELRRLAPRSARREAPEPGDDEKETRAQTSADASD
ncbi:MarR family winged helix-turn-helix transcriptional regulator [Allonocardiopsis opalescens]|uniref:DNA-binding MarR family transcriptional regulator n=1 Tax=Allonocardiopsis opalescens TaxID=1144618 RepID=A0A2T0PYI1_9ACTN|nr:MarR family transcriptional regulator [Allonocardiopsis opalescens]PRX96593.1 DNA-binding MarR family transcriptional regulator [Allonocardiopsis opalescens]